MCDSRGEVCDDEAPDKVTEGEEFRERVPEATTTGGYQRMGEELCWRRELGRVA